MIITKKSTNIMSKASEICYYPNGQYAKSSHPIITIDGDTETSHCKLCADCIFNITKSSKIKMLTYQKYTFADKITPFKIKRFMKCYKSNGVIYAICEDIDGEIYVIKILSRGALITNVYKIPEYGVYQIILGSEHIMLIDCIFGIRNPVIKLTLDLVPVPSVSYETLNNSELINFDDMPLDSYPQSLEIFDGNTLICQVIENGASCFKIINENGVLGEILNVKDKSGQIVSFGTEDIFRTFGNLAIVANGRDMMLIDIIGGKIIHTLTHDADIVNIDVKSRYQFIIDDNNKESCCFISNMK